jgi:exodeoxyribonuclease-1
MASSFLWYDLETFGTDPAQDRIAQFAAMRTDLDFQPIEPPQILYCRPSEDVLPQPESCLVTGITPQRAASLGVREAEFMAAVHRTFMEPSSCVLGYNTLRFDDEVLRHAFYRNLYDPYEREWKFGNSRWDLIDPIRAAQALRPEGIEWPRDDTGAPVFRLERLAAVNGIRHDSAHDALSDVQATIALARLLRERQPRLFRFLFENRGKHEIERLLGLGSWTPVLHVSEKYPAARNCIALVLPLCRHPRNPNAVLVFDLAADPGLLLDLSAEEIRRRLFSPSDALPEGVERIPLKGVHINRCPVVAPGTVLRAGDAERLGIDPVRGAAHGKKLEAAADVVMEKIRAVFSGETVVDSSDQDPELMLYRGGFLPEADRHELERIRRMSPTELARYRPKFIDPRLEEILFRYRARNFPETLTEIERERWESFRRRRLTVPGAAGSLTLAEYFGRITALRASERDAARQAILNELEAYGRNLLC